MLTLLGYGLLAILVGAVLFLLAAYLLPPGEQIAPPIRDEPIWALPAERRLVPEDVAVVRLPIALRGYRFAETDLLLDRLADELRARDAEIATLREMPVASDERDYAERDYVPPQAPDPLDSDEHSTRPPSRPMSTERPRCPWANSAPEYVAYHDDEWGTPLRGERELFERLSLEAFQSGLSWLIILRKRPGFRAAFANFDVDTVAGYDESDVARLLADPGIVRNRAKINAAIGNARAIRADVPEGLDDLLWSFAPVEHARPTALADVMSTSPESTALAKELKRRGFRFVGPTTAYALMQATGMVDDHIATCWRAGT